MCLFFSVSVSRDKAQVLRMLTDCSLSLPLPSNKFLFNTQIIYSPAVNSFRYFSQISTNCLFHALPTKFISIYVCFTGLFAHDTYTHNVFILLSRLRFECGRSPLWSLPKKVLSLLLVCHLQAIYTHAHTIGAQIQCVSIGKGTEKGTKHSVKENIKIVCVINAPRRKCAPYAFTLLVLGH